MLSLNFLLLQQELLLKLSLLEFQDQAGSLLLQLRSPCLGPLLQLHELLVMSFAQAVFICLHLTIQGKPETRILLFLKRFQLLLLTRELLLEGYLAFYELVANFRNQGFSPCINGGGRWKLPCRVAKTRHSNRKRVGFRHSLASGGM